MAIGADRVIRAPGPTVTVYPSRLRAGGLALGAIGCTAAGLSLASVGGLGAVLLGGAVTVVSALTAAVLLWRLFAERPVLVLDERGITNATSATGPDFLAWEQVTMVFPRRLGPGPGWIAVDVRKPGQEPVPESGHGQPVAMQIHTFALPLSVDATLREIAAVAPEHVWVDTPDAQP